MIEADTVVVRDLVGEYNGCMLGLLSGGSTSVLARARDVLHVCIGWRILEYSGSSCGGSYETRSGSDQLENSVFTAIYGIQNEAVGGPRTNVCLSFGFQPTYVI